MLRNLFASLRRPTRPRPAPRFRPTLDGLEDRSLMAVTIGLDPVSGLSGLSNPLLATNAADGTNRLFVVEQGGRILVRQPGGGVSTFLDITSRVRSGGEQGLLGLAFHPDYETNGRFFVHYTTNAAGSSANPVNQVAEYRVNPSNPNQALTTETLILRFPAQPFGNHNGGSIEFGPDGFLYIAKGDGGSGDDPGNRAQNRSDATPDSWFGKIHRIDINGADAYPGDPNRNYAIPADNPYVGEDGLRDEIFAYGLRNPYRMSFDRGTGLLYVGDVGQNFREEINIVVNGGNYGWRAFEGTPPNPGGGGTAQFPAEVAALTGIAIDPITEVPYGAQAASITGGYVYRGTQGTLPVGSYLFGDFVQRNVFLYENGVRTTLLTGAQVGTGGITSFGEDETGELYVVRFNGTVSRVVSTSGNLPPAVAPVADQTVGSGQDTVTVTVSATDPNGTTPVLSASAQSLALVLDRQLGLRVDAGGLYENAFGGGEKWLLGRNGPNDWYFVLPNGELWRWDFQFALTGTLVGTPGATYHARPELLYNAEQAFNLDLSYGLRVDAGGLYENFFGAGERWLIGRNNQFYIVLPDGRFLLWDGSGSASGTQLGNLGSSYHELIRLLYEGDQGQALATLSYSGDQLVVDRDDGFVSSTVVTATASDGELTGSQTFTVTVTA